MQKKSQAAMEFLMTYGWAILVVLIVIGALAYFGVLKPSNFLPDKCSFPISISCKNYVIKTKAAMPNNGGSILFELTNGGGNDIRITQILAQNRDLFKTNCSYFNLTSGVAGNGILLRNGYSRLFLLNYSTLWRKPGIPATTDICKIDHAYAGSSEKTKWDVTIKWYPAGSDKKFTHSSDGELLAKVEK
jgi:hypothetical protein